MNAYVCVKIKFMNNKRAAIGLILLSSAIGDHGRVYSREAQ